MPQLDQVLPFLVGREDVATIRTRIEVQLDRQLRGEALPSEWQRYRALPLGDLKESLRSELSRRDAITRRAQAYLGSVAVMSAFTIGIIGVLRGASDFPVLPIGAASLAAVSFLAGAAWSAWRVARPEHVYDLDLQSRMQGEAPLSEDALKDSAIFSIHMNQAHNLIFSQYSERASRCLRNGLVCLVLIMFLLLLNIHHLGATKSQVEEPAPNKAMQLAPNSLFQSGGIAILAAIGSAPRGTVSAVWRS